MTTVPTTIRTAAVLVWVSAIGLGVPCLMALRNLLAGRPIPRVLGYPAYGEGPFEQHGIVTTPLLISAFLAVCLLEAVAAASLWGGHKLGAVLALIAVPLGAIFWWGFALPYPPIIAVIRTVLLVLSWRSLT